MQVKVLIKGAVQGVGFRYFVKGLAKDFNLTGWVRNTEEDNVEAVFQSSATFHSGDASSSERADQEARKQIEEVIALCKEGPPMAQVKNVEVSWENTKEAFKEFEIR